MKYSRGVDLCKNVGGSKHRHRKQRRYFWYIIGVKINVDSC